MIDARQTPTMTTIRGAVRFMLLTGLVVIGSFFAVVQAASAHGEILDASPRDRAVVGGEIDEISIQFIGIAHPGDHTVSVKDPDGVSIIPVGALEQDLQRLILPIQPLTKPGTHTVTAVVDGIDGDTVATSFSFEYQPGAPSPEPIKFEQETVGIDGITIGLMVLTALSIIGFIFLIRHRLRITAPGAAAEDDDQYEGDGVLDDAAVDDGDEDLDEAKADGDRDDAV